MLLLQGVLNFSDELVGHEVIGMMAWHWRELRRFDRCVVPLKILVLRIHNSLVLSFVYVVLDLSRYFIDWRPRCLSKKLLQSLWGMSVWLEHYFLLYILWHEIKRASILLQNLSLSFWIRAHLWKGTWMGIGLLLPLDGFNVFKNVFVDNEFRVLKILNELLSWGRDMRSFWSAPLWWLIPLDTWLLVRWDLLIVIIKFNFLLCWRNFFHHGNLAILFWIVVSLGQVASSLWVYRINIVLDWELLYVSNMAIEQLNFLVSS